MANMINAGIVSFLAVSDKLSGTQALDFIRQNYPDSICLGKVSDFIPCRVGLTTREFEALRIRHKITDSHYMGSPVYYVFSNVQKDL